MLTASSPIHKQKASAASFISIPPPSSQTACSAEIKIICLKPSWLFKDCQKVFHGPPMHQVIQFFPETKRGFLHHFLQGLSDWEVEELSQTHRHNIRNCFLSMEELSLSLCKALKNAQEEQLLTNYDDKQVTEVLPHTKN